jgi:hypothetical protein
VQQALMEPKVLPAWPVLSDLKDRLALRVLLVQLVLKDCQGLKGTRD